MVTERERLTTLETTIETTPEKADWRELCQLLSSDETDIRTEAEDLRSTLIETHPDLETTAETLIGLLSEESTIRLKAVDTLSRVVRTAPRELLPLAGSYLEQEDTDTRVVGSLAYVFAGVGNQTAALTKPYIPTLIDLLSHSDLRVQSLAMYALNNIAESYPSELHTAVEHVLPLLEYQGIAGGTPGKPGVKPVPERDVGERLTPRLVRPRNHALEFLQTVSNRHPDAIVPISDTLVALIRKLDQNDIRRLYAAFEIFFQIAKTEPDILNNTDAIPVLQQWYRADGVNQGIRVAAMNVLRELGQEIPTPHRVDTPTPVEHTGTVRDGDLERARALEMEIHRQEGVDLDEILRLLRSADSDIRDNAAFSAQFLTDHRTGDVHDRAEEFLALVGDPDDCTRRHLVRPPGLLSSLVKAYPREYEHALFDLLEHDDHRIQADALQLIAAAADAYPSGYRSSLSEYREHLEDPHPLVRQASLSALNVIGNQYPEDIIEYVPRVTKELDTEVTRSMALTVLETVAKHRPTALTPVIPDILELFRELVTTNSDTGEPTTDPMGQRVQLTSGDPSYRRTLGILFELAKHDPDAIRPVEPLLAELVETRADSWQTALNIIIELAEKQDYVS